MALKPLATESGQDRIVNAINSFGQTGLNAAAEALASAEAAQASASDANGYANVAKNNATATEDIYNAIKSQYGYPFQAATAADMTDTTKIYVYVGSEVGYTNGDWYYYDGANWTSGGTFNAVTFTTDKTLTVSGSAADAQITGDKIFSALDMDDAPIRPTYTNGKGIGSGGAAFDSAKRIATLSYVEIKNAQKIDYSIVDGYRAYVCVYSSDSEGSFIRNSGWITGDGTIYKYSSNEKYIRIMFASVDDDTTVTTADAGKATFTYTPYLSYWLNNATLMYRRLLTSADDLDDVKTIGIYNVVNGNTPTNAPYGFGGGTVLVMNGYNNVSNVAPITALVQMAISPYVKNVWMRYCNNLYEWRDWIPVTTPTISIPTTWLAIGDSITKGVYSDGEGTHDGTYGWVGKLSSALGYIKNNMGVRGMGYIAVGGNGITFEQTLQAAEALVDDYNLVTVSLGINDYNTSTITLGALETVIKDSIQRLATKFPNSRLVYITPFNASRRGDASTKYSYNYEYGGRSLKDIADLIQSCCEEYGVECIYASDGFLMNAFNITTLLPDGVHPSITGHDLIAKNMAHLLLF